MVFSVMYAGVVGLAMIGQWVLSYRKGDIPELRSEPIRIAFHLAGEMTTALALLVGALGVALGSVWGNPLYCVAVGMLFYTAIVSPGYFAQRGQWGWTVLFGLIIILGFLSLWMLLS